MIDTTEIRPTDYMARSRYPNPTPTLNPITRRICEVLAYAEAAHHEQMRQHAITAARHEEVVRACRSWLERGPNLARRVDGQARDVDTERRGEVERRRRGDRP